MRRRVNVPNVKIKLPALIEKDKEDIRFASNRALILSQLFLYVQLTVSVRSRKMLDLAVVLQSR